MALLGHTKKDAFPVPRVICFVAVRLDARGSQEPIRVSTLMNNAMVAKSQRSQRCLHMASHATH